MNLEDSGYKMSYKIQITVDEQLNDIIKARAKQMGLSVSSYARLALMSAISKNDSLLQRAIRDINSNDIEAIALGEFNHQINKVQGVDGDNNG